MIEQAIILAGGAGTRMSSVSSSAKSLMDLHGRSILEWQVKFFVEHGVFKFLLLLGHLADEVRLAAGSIARAHGVQIDTLAEDEPLGTGGAILNAMPRISDTFFVAHGDLVLNTDLGGLQRVIQTEVCDLALLYHPSNHPEDSDLVVVEEHSFVTSVATKPHEKFLGRCLGNAGLYAFRKTAFLKLPSDLVTKKEKLDLDRQLIPRLLDNGARVAAVRNIGFVKDVGTPERFMYVETHWDSISVKPKERPAIFIDRDGTLNKLRGFITQKEQIELVEDAGAVVREFKRLGFWVLVITNQPVIARGEVSPFQLDEIHGKLERDLLEKETIVDDFFYCPHHPDAGFNGEVKSLKISCECRKPEIGLVTQAQSIYPIDMSNSWMIGDSWRDVQLAKSAGIRSILLGGDENVDLGADFLASSLTHALAIVKDQTCQ